MVSVLAIKAGQLLTTTNPQGLFVLSINAERLPIDKRIYHETGLFSKRIPIGDIFLCLEVRFYDEELSYGLKILWKENIYYVFCDLNEVRMMEQ